MYWLRTIWDSSRKNWDSTVQTDWRKVFKLYSPRLDKDDLELYQSIQDEVSTDTLEIILVSTFNIKSSEEKIKKVTVNFLNNSSTLVKYSDIYNRQIWYVSELGFISWKTLHEESWNYDKSVIELCEKINSYVEDQTTTDLTARFCGEIFPQVCIMNIKIVQVLEWEMTLMVTDICQSIKQFVKRNNWDLMQCIDICT